MTQVEPKPITHPTAMRAPKGGRLLHMVGTTDPKDIAILYMVTSFGFFMVGGLMAMLMRAELASPGLQFLSNEQYNQLFTMHGTIMLLLYATPILRAWSSPRSPSPPCRPPYGPTTCTPPARSCCRSSRS